MRDRKEYNKPWQQASGQKDSDNKKGPSPMRGLKKAPA
jgi:hypothetical protein